jgi:hypothetical protein
VSNAGGFTRQAVGGYPGGSFWDLLRILTIFGMLFDSSQCVLGVRGNANGFAQDIKRAPARNFIAGEFLENSFSQFQENPFPPAPGARSFANDLAAFAIHQIIDPGHPQILEAKLDAGPPKIFWPKARIAHLVEFI